jgi:hypothetical protein
MPSAWIGVVGVLLGTGLTGWLALVRERRQVRQQDVTRKQEWKRQDEIRKQEWKRQDESLRDKSAQEVYDAFFDGLRVCYIEYFEKPRLEWENGRLDLQDDEIRNKWGATFLDSGDKLRWDATLPRLDLHASTRVADLAWKIRDIYVSGAATRSLDLVGIIAEASQLKHQMLDEIHSNQPQH